MDSGPPPPFEFPADPPMVDVESTAPPPKPRPGWFPWAIGLGVVVIAVAAFFVTKSIAGSGSGSPAAATAGNGSSSNSGSGGSAGSSGSGLQGRFPGASGEITAIDGTTLTVKDRQNQSVKVATSDSTRITIEKTVAVSDIAKGDRISVTGKQSGSTIAASRITIMNMRLRTPNRGSQGGATPSGGPPGGFGAPGDFNGRGGPPVTNANGNANPNGSANRRPSGGFAFGTVTKVDGSTITISSFNGSTTTVTTSSSTAVTKSVQGSFGDLAVGQNIRAVGTSGSDGTVAATDVNEGSGFGFFGGARRGQRTP